MDRKYYLILLFFVLVQSSIFGQFKLYESTFNGGVVTGGYSNGATVPSGSGSFNVNIPAGSTIRRAYLIAGECGTSPAVTVTLNGSPFTFNSSNIVTTGFNTIYGGISSVHAIDITSSINPATSAYTIAAPVQSNTVSNKYPEFYLYIAFDNPFLPTINSAIYLNTTNLNVNSFSWTLNTVQPVTNAFPVGFAILGGYAATGRDCEQVIVNGTNIGSFGGQDFNGSSSWGCMAGFQYYNTAVTGYNDDNGNLAIAGTDALSNIQTLIPGAVNSIPVTFQHCGGGSDNHVWALFLTWSGVVLDEGELNLKGKAQNDDVLLDWDSNCEKGFAHFNVQRSFNGKDFEDIGQVMGKTVIGNQTYDFRDKNPAIGMNWYRLQAIDQVGSSSYTQVIEIEFQGEEKLIASISPNPVPFGKDFELNTTEQGDFDWTIISLGDAREMKNGKESSVSSFSVSVEGLAVGPYLIIIRKKNKVQSLRFVIE